MVATSVSGREKQSQVYALGENNFSVIDNLCLTSGPAGYLRKTYPSMSFYQSKTCHAQQAN